MVKYSLFVATLLGLAAAQTPGKGKENHPKLTTWECTKKGCKAQESAIVLDSGSRPNYQKNNPSLNCGSWGAAANKTVCPDEKTCAQNCLMDGIPNYADYGITTQGANLKLNFFGKNGFQSPRAYLLAKDEKKYEMLKLTGKEFTFDVDLSRAPCGMNGALYLSEMKADGGKSKLNPGGAAYGTGYCDAQCFVTPFVDGVGNIEGDGICCNEMDIWEANSRATAIAPHTCAKPSLFRCKGAECGQDGLCDKPGCAQNSYRDGAKSFYGRNLKLDTTKPFTVVTQFPAQKGVLQAVVRKYVQNGIVFENEPRNVTMTDDYCKAQGAPAFFRNGAMKGMGDALSRGMVLAFSLWNDEGNFMSWLDGQSTNSGPCDATEGKPDNIYKIEKAPTVTFSQIKWGEIGTTFKARNQFHA